MTSRPQLCIQYGDRISLVALISGDNAGCSYKVTYRVRGKGVKKVYKTFYGGY